MLPLLLPAVAAQQKHGSLVMLPPLHTHPHPPRLVDMKNLQPLLLRMDFLVLITSRGGGGGLLGLSSAAMCNKAKLGANANC